MKTPSLIVPLASALLISASCGGTAPAPVDESLPPNILLLVVDTLRGDMVFGAESETHTPGLDALAEHGVTFPSAFSHAPMTLPAHTTLFSSRAPFETGVLNNWQSVPEELPLLAEWLQRQGYQTRAVVSLGTLYKRENTALDRGFDEFVENTWEMEQAPAALASLRKTLDGFDAARPFFLFAHFSDPHAPYNSHHAGGPEAEVFLDGELLATLPTANMSMWETEFELEAGAHEVEIRSDSPFMVNTFQWTHNGRFMAPEWVEGAVRTDGERVRVVGNLKQKEHSRLRLWISETVTDEELVHERYRGEIEWMDESLARLVDELKARELYDNTVIVFTSDHGEALGEHGAIGHVENLYDEMLHVPLVIKPKLGDARIEALARARHRIVPLQDLAPTILELAELPAMPGMRGASLLAADREPLLIAETHKPESSRNLLCLRDEEFKLIYDYDAKTFELYDLVKDPHESLNLFDSHESARPTWPAQLEQIAALVQAGGLLDGEVSEETRELLDSLGYAGQ